MQSGGRCNPSSNSHGGCQSESARVVRLVGVNAMEEHYGRQWPGAARWAKDANGKFTVGAALDHAILNLYGWRFEVPGNVRNAGFCL